MQKINRNINSTISTSDKDFNYSQASINSNGRITIRNYDDNDNDEIIILNDRETFALIQLLKLIKDKESLPF